ncbi:hypothetical protein [Aeromicrobium sp.]|uniref:hypothetical protein n=1 Tax=Aeromicrobium sp. TaxID=1871063 RepID=UPI0019B1FEF9|nr:hypothetical protein [Aeromicrobium sp.]MBC7630782.1 hypothetical protein [Aeromicrobium sp.]
MKMLAALALFALLAGCGGSSDSGSGSSMTSKEAEAKTCVEVRAGIADFNSENYAGTVSHFAKAKTTAKIYARVSQEPKADALLDAVEYYANLAPDDYPEAARTSESFARSKAVTLTQCASDSPVEAPTQST